MLVDKKQVMNTSKGYIVPVILVVLLLVLAGFFVFRGQIVESPITPSPLNTSTTTDESQTSLEEEEVEQNTATTSDIDIEVQATTSISIESEE